MNFWKIDIVEKKLGSYHSSVKVIIAAIEPILNNQLFTQLIAVWLNVMSYVTNFCFADSTFSSQVILQPRTSDNTKYSKEMWYCWEDANIPYVDWVYIC